MMLLSILLSLVLAMSLPNPAITPGAVNPAITQTTACSTKWGHDRRQVTEAMKRAVAASYGMDRKAIVGEGAGPCCEFDHLVSRELGGADDVKNLWPQPWIEARQKDRLENKLHALVCAGSLSLADAQLAIRTDWPMAYRKYVK